MLRKLNFLKVYLSPFKLPKLKWCVGKTPYFLPRSKSRFNLVGLGWNTKWDSCDFRFEHPPILSFTFRKYQITVTVEAVHQYHFWECWLYYENCTDKTKTKTERLKEAREDFPCKWTCYKNKRKIEIDYWNLILKNKWT